MYEQASDVEKSSHHARGNVALFFAMPLLGYFFGRFREESQLLSDEVRRHEDQFHRRFEESNDALLLLDEDATILQLNEAAATMCGQPRSKLRGLKKGNALGCINAKDAPCGQSDRCSMCPIKNLFYQALDHGEETSHHSGDEPISIEVIRQDQGHEKHLKLMSSQVYTRFGRKVLMQITDITDSVGLRLEAERASQVQTDFLSLVSHELRTPLNPIIGLGELLEEKLRGEDRELLRVMNCAARKELELVDNLIEFTCLTTARNSPRDFAMGFIERIQQQFAEHQLSNDNENVRYEFRNGFGAFQSIPEGTFITIEHQLIESIIRHLLSNSAKFTEEGTISLSVGKHECFKERAEAQIVIELEDTGCGLQAENFQKLKEPFTYCVDTRHMNSSNSGLGLGLAIITECLNMLNGTIDVISSQKRGTCVRIQIPFATAGESREWSTSRKEA